MKILLAIDSKKPKLVGDRALRWASRTGYEMRLFAPRNKRQRYLQVIDDANYDYYLDIKKNQLITKMDPMQYAKAHDFDLVLLVPEGLWSWRKGEQFKPMEVVHCAQVIGRARIEFGAHPRKRIKHFANGSIMQRVR